MARYCLRTATQLRTGLLVLMIACAQAGAQGLSTPAPDGAQVYFIEPADGAVVGEQFTVKFGLRGMGVAPAGVELPATGHHHLLIGNPSIDTTAPLPSSDQVRHFGKGQTETQVTLPPGEHQLQLILGNHLHVPHTPPIRSQTIRVRVQADSK